MKTKTIHLQIDPAMLFMLLGHLAQAQSDPENICVQVNPMFQNARLVRYDWVQATMVEVEQGKLLHSFRPYLHCELEVPEDAQDTSAYYSVLNSK